MRPLIHPDEYFLIEIFCLCAGTEHPKTIAENPLAETKIQFGERFTFPGHEGTKKLDLISALTVLIAYEILLHFHWLQKFSHRTNGLTPQKEKSLVN